MRLMGGAICKYSPLINLIGRVLGDTAILFGVQQDQGGNSFIQTTKTIRWRGGESIILIINYMSVNVNQHFL